MEGEQVFTYECVICGNLCKSTDEDDDMCSLCEASAPG